MSTEDQSNNNKGWLEIEFFLNYIYIDFYSVRNLQWRLMAVHIRATMLVRTRPEIASIWRNFRVMNNNFAFVCGHLPLWWITGTLQQSTFNFPTTITCFDQKSPFELMLHAMDEMEVKIRIYKLTATAVRTLLHLAQTCFTRLIIYFTWSTEIIKCFALTDGTYKIELLI